LASNHDAALIAWASEFNTSLGDVERGRLLAFCRLLLTWNARINLTGAREMDDLLGEHLCDSFAMSRLVPAGATLLDVGTGGGLPALPFALLRPDVSQTLVEPRAKRIAFLREATRQLALPRLEVCPGRLGDIDARTSRFDVASSRATFGPAVWLAQATNWVRPGGRILVFAAQTPGPLVGIRPVDSVQYRTRLGHARWIGAYVPRGTTPPLPIDTPLDPS